MEFRRSSSSAFEEGGGWRGGGGGGVDDSVRNKQKDSDSDGECLITSRWRVNRHRPDRGDRFVCVCGGGGEREREKECGG